MERTSRGSNRSRRVRTLRKVCISPRQLVVSTSDDPADARSPFNGRLHLVAPARFIVFPEPTSIQPAAAGSSGHSWLDVDGVRHFTTDFYADLLADLRVALVLRLDSRTNADDRHFIRRGIAVEHALSGPSGRITFQTIDRLLELAAQTKGPVAVQSPSGGAAAAALLATCLFRTGAFPAPQPAFAWLQLACPGPHLSLDRALPAAHSSPPLCSRRRASCISHLGAADAPEGEAEPPRAARVRPPGGGRRFSAPHLHMQGLPPPAEDPAAEDAPAAPAPPSPADGGAPPAADTAGEAPAPAAEDRARPRHRATAGRPG
jgi:hypothetical protein